MDIREWIKANAKEGTNVEEAIKLLDDLDPLKNVKSKEDALSFMRRNDLFNRALDSETSKAVDGYKSKFQEQDLPEIRKTLRDEIQKELNPEETPEQKRIRELEEGLRQRDEREKLEARKAALRKKASEIGFDPIRAERYAVFGEDAESVLVEDHEHFTSSLNGKLEEMSKKRFSTDDPKSRSRENVKTISRADFDQLPPSQRMELAKEANEGKAVIED